MKKRIAILLLALGMLLSVLPAYAAPSLFFTAINDTLPELNDDTMSFWQNGTMYIAASTISDGGLGIHYARQREQGTVIFYTQSKTLIFDTNAGTVTDGVGKAYSGMPIFRGNSVFVPIQPVAGVFGLQYSYIQTAYGYLVRIKNNRASLSDDQFVTAADGLMAQRYAQYEREHTPAQPQTPQQTQPQTSPEETHSRSVLYLAFTASENAARTLETFSRSGAGVTVIFPADRLAASGDVLRRAVAGGNAVAVQVDAAEGAESTLAAIAAANEMIWRCTNCKTRLVRLDHASEETVAAVRAAGYCPLLFRIAESGRTASAFSERILSAAAQNGGVCRVYLGSDSAIPYSLSLLLGTLRSGRGTLLRMNEISA